MSAPAVDWDVVKVGDPDPFPGPVVRDEWSCAEYAWLRPRHMVLCKREDEHHTHVAGDGVTVLAVWS